MCLDTASVAEVISAFGPEADGTPFKLIEMGLQNRTHRAQRETGGIKFDIRLCI